MSKTKSHQVYKNAAGKQVPGVTTVIGILEKPAIHNWIAKITREGHDWAKYRDEAGDIGTLAHALILSYFREENADTSDYSKEQIDQAENAFLFFLDWAKGKKFIPILVEKPLVSESMQVGGCLDFYGKIDGGIILTDFKTGGIYDEAYIQTCAYREMIIENGYEAPDKIIILGIPRKDTEHFTEQTHTSFERGIELFKLCRRIYELRR